MYGFKVRDGLVTTLAVVGGLFVAASAAHADYTFSAADAVFQHESVDDRVRLQLLLAAGGYVNSVPMVEFSRHTFAGIQAFQVDNGYPITGEVESNPEEI